MIKQKTGHIYTHIVFVTFLFLFFEMIFILIFEFTLIYLLYVLFVLQVECNFEK